MNLRALQYFVKLADLKHFSKAADACFVSQPTLSTQIRKLEDELGVQLVERAPKNIMLTPVGAEVAERARLVLSDIDQIRAVARRAGDPSDGRLRLGLFPTLAPYLLPHVVPAIRKRYPNLSLHLAEEKTEDIVKMLQQGELDAALLALPINGDGLEVETLFEEPFVLAVPDDHPLRSKKHVKLGQGKRSAGRPL
jgi:LysR family hydrogen peroxide-inducible transcriptional activator